MTSPEDSSPPTRMAAWERRAELPLLALAVAFLIAYAWPVLDPSTDRDLVSFFRVVSWVVWAAFALDLAVRLYLADERRAYAWQHWYDVALVILPMLRPLRLLRLLAFVRVLNRTAAGSLVGRATTYVIATAVLAVFLGALAMLDAEREAPTSPTGANPNITTFGDALWWATTTVTTVGYGDRYPVTFEGRLVAFVLMLVGIGTVGVITAALATWLISNVRAEARPRPQDDEHPAT